MEDWFFRMSRWVGSLQVAIFILISGAIILTIGTMVESWYNSRIAQELVYHTWWFTAFLGLFFLNILFAAVKKWPWKRYQTGFIVLHTGLLTMIAGGILNSLSGTDALMTLVDSSDPHVLNQYHLPNASDQILEKDHALISVRRIGADDGKPYNYAFSSGSLQWRDDDLLAPKVPWLLTVLHWMQHPLPHTWNADLSKIRKDAELEVINFYPHVSRDPYSPAGPDRKDAFPAIRYTIMSPMFGALPDRWTAAGTDDQVQAMGGAMVENLGRVDSALIDEFLKPVSDAERGGKGQLVIRLAGTTFRFDVEALLERDKPLMQGWKIRGIKYAPFVGERKSSHDGPIDPVIEFEIVSPENKDFRYFLAARRGGDLMPVGEQSERLTARLEAWFHPADYRYGMLGSKGSPAVRGLLQFVTTDANKLYFRSFNSSSGDFKFEKSGFIEDIGERIEIWKGMDWEFRVDEFLPKAVQRERFVPRDLRPGLEERRGIVPAIHVRLRAGKDVEEFWLQQDVSEKQVKLGNDMYGFTYRMQERPIGFKVKLLRAEQGVDPGTQQAASYSSYVQLTDRKNGIDAQDAYITMNHPLVHNGYTFFQSTYRFLSSDDHTEKPISLSGFTVAHDPGLWLKYLGSTMLALGIAIMFYMRAYFFKPRARPAQAPTTLATQEG